MSLTVCVQHGLRLVFGLSAAAALCATATSAQDPPPHNYHGFATQVAWDATLGADGSFENVLAGRYTDDVLLDVVVQKGTQLVLFADTAQQHVYSPFGAEALDAVRWPGSSTDAIIASEATGATVYSWTARLQIQPLTGVEPGALDLDLEIDPVGGATYLGALHPDGQTLSVGLLQAGMCAGTCYQPLGGFDVLEPVIAWELFQWDGVAGLELLVHTPTQFRVTDLQGNDLVLPVVSAEVKSILGRYYDAALGSDRGIWFTELDPLPNYIAIVFDQRYPELEPAINFGPLDAGRFELMDYNGNGRMDILFPTETTGEAFVLYGAHNPVFPFEQTFGLDLEQSTLFDLRGDPSIDSTPTVASIGDSGDFDLDGDVDFLFVSDDFQHLNFVRGDSVDEEFKVPALRSVDFSETNPEGTAVTYRFELGVGIPFPTYPRGLDGTSVIKKLVTEVYYQPALGLPINITPRTVLVTPLVGPAVPNNRVRHDRAPTPPVPAGDVNVDGQGGSNNGGPGIGPSEFYTLEFDATGDNGGAIYQFRFRLLDNADVQIGPAQIQYFTNDQQTSEELRNEYTPWGEPTLDPDNGFGFHRRGGIGGFCATCR